MRELGHSWSKTTLFSIEHNARRLLASEAFDLLICLGYDPEKDLMLIFGEPPSPADYSMQRCGRCATKVEDAWNVYLGALEVAEKSLTEETEKGEITKEICRCTTEEAADLGKVDERGNQRKTL